MATTALQQNAFLFVKLTASVLVAGIAWRHMNPFAPGVYVRVVQDVFRSGAFDNRSPFLGRNSGRNLEGTTNASPLLRGQVPARMFTPVLFPLCRASMASVTIPVLRDSVVAIDASDLTPDSSQGWANYAEGVRFLALRTLGDGDAADDVAQETILRALRTTIDANKAAIRDPAAFIHGIARHVIADALRRKYQTLSLEVAETIPENDNDVLEGMISDEERARVRQAIRKLPQKERSLLIMSFVNGMTSPEIAAKLGESADMIRKRKSRAVQRLRDVFFAN